MSDLTRSVAEFMRKRRLPKGFDAQMRLFMKFLRERGIPGLELDVRAECDDEWKATYACMLIDIGEPPDEQRRFFSVERAREIIEEAALFFFHGCRLITGSSAGRQLKTGMNILHTWYIHHWTVEIEAYVMAFRCSHCDRVLADIRGQTRHEKLCAKREPLEQVAHAKLAAKKSRRGSHLRRELHP